MNDQVVIEFREKVIPITKAYEEEGKLYLEGEASGPEIDLDQQFMTPECIVDMADQINKTGAPFRYYDEHNKRGILADLGAVVEAGVTPEFHLKTKVELDQENSAAVTLWKKVKQGKKFGQSIAGKVLGLATKKVGERIYTGFSKLQLDHIANTTAPSWEWSLGSLVAKSLEQQGLDWNEAPEYGGELELPHTMVYVEKVLKRSKPDPKAGKGYLLLEDLLKRLNTLFGWESYQERVAEDNRDDISLLDNPAVKPLFPVGSLKPPAKAEEDGEEWEGYIQKAVDMVAVEQRPSDVRGLAEIYERLHWIADGLGRRDERNGNKDNKKTVTRLNAAMAAIADALKQTLSKSEPEPVTYGEPPPPEPVQIPERVLPDNALRSFDQVTEAEPAVQRATPEPSVVGGELADFSQVAETAEEQIARMPQAVAKTIRSFEDVVGNIFEADASPTDKQKVLLQVGKAFLGELHEQLDVQRPEEERVADAVSKAMAPLMQEIESLRAELALVKSQKPPAAPTEGEPPLVRKSLPGKLAILQPARVVKSQQEAPTFLDLVRGEGGLLP